MLLRSALLLACLCACACRSEQVAWRPIAGAHDSLIVTMAPDPLRPLIDRSLSRLGWAMCDGDFHEFRAAEDGVIAYEGTRPDVVRIRIRVHLDAIPQGSRVTCAVSAWVQVDGIIQAALSSGVLERRFFDTLTLELGELK